MDQGNQPRRVIPSQGAGGSTSAHLAILGVVSLALWLATVPVGDSPINDDWVYALAVKALLQTGRFQLPSPSSANAIAQIYWGALFCLPFGFSFDALRISTAVLGIVGVLATYLFLLETAMPRRAALLGALCLAASPIYLGLTVTFMTDVPFAALFTVALWLYVRGVARDEAATIGAAILVAFASLAIRQFGIALLVGFGAAHLVRRGIRPGSILVAVAPVAAGLILQLGYSKWMIATHRTPVLPVQITELLSQSLPAFLQRVVHMALAIVPCIGLLVGPFLVMLLAAPSSVTARWVRRLSLPFLAVACAIVATLWRVADPLPPPGNVLAPFGVGPLLLRDTNLLHLNLPVIPGAVSAAWMLLTILGAMAGLVVLAVVADAARRLLPVWRADWLSVLLLVTTVGYLGLVFLLSLRSNVYDRYMLPVIPPLLVLLVRAIRPPTQPWPSSDPGVTPALCAIAACAAFAVLATHDNIAWHRTRWAATDRLIQSGVTPDRIDGGYEFNGWLLYHPGYGGHAGKSYWWVEDDEYQIAAGPLDGYAESARLPVPRWLHLGPGTVIVLHRTERPSS